MEVLQTLWAILLIFSLGAVSDAVTDLVGADHPGGIALARLRHGVISPAMMRITLAQ